MTHTREENIKSQHTPEINPRAQIRNHKHMIINQT